MRKTIKADKTEFPASFQEKISYKGEFTKICR